MTISSVPSTCIIFYFNNYPNDYFCCGHMLWILLFSPVKLNARMSLFSGTHGSWCRWEWGKNLCLCLWHRQGQMGWSTTAWVTLVSVVLEPPAFPMAFSTVYDLQIWLSVFGPLVKVVMNFLFFLWSFYEPSQWGCNDTSIWIDALRWLTMICFYAMHKNCI